MRKKFLGLLSIAVAKIRKVSQNAIFLFFIYSNFVLFYVHSAFYKRLALYLGGRSNGFPTEFHIKPNCYIGNYLLRVNLFQFSTISLPL